MIEFLNQEKINIDLALLKKIAEIILKDHNINLKNYFLSVAFLDKNEMRKVNKKYRKKDKSTDVISVELQNKNFADKQNWLGEILICENVVSQNAKKYKTTTQKEIVKVFIHGLLHILGYDHEKDSQAQEMEDKEAFYFSKLRF